MYMHSFVINKNVKWRRLIWVSLQFSDLFHNVTSSHLSSQLLDKSYGKHDVIKPVQTAYEIRKIRKKSLTWL